MNKKQYEAFRKKLISLITKKVFEQQSNTPNNIDYFNFLSWNTINIQNNYCDVRSQTLRPRFGSIHIIVWAVENGEQLARSFQRPLKHPYENILNDYVDLLLAVCLKFGVTPGSKGFKIQWA